MYLVRKRKLKIPGILALLAVLVLIATELQAGGHGQQPVWAVNGTELASRAHGATGLSSDSRAVTTKTPTSSGNIHGGISST